MVGKLAVPEHILTKPAPLTNTEWATMRTHPGAGAAVIRRMEAVAEIDRLSAPSRAVRRRRVPGRAVRNAPG